jgi:acyl carrier protein
LAGKLIRIRQTRLQCMLFVPQESVMLAELTQEIIDLVKTEATEVDLTGDSDLQDVGLDSLKFMSVVFKIEARYDIELQEEDAEDLRTVGDLVSLVLGHVAEQS